MENRFTRTVLMSALLLTVIAGCEQLPTTSDKSGSLVRSEHPDVAAGSVPDGVPSVTMTESGNGPMPAGTLARLKQIRSQNPAAPFTGILSLLENPGAADPAYSYHPVRLPFPVGLIRRSRGGERWFRYTLATDEEEILLQFEAILPEDEKASELVKQWLGKKIRTSGKSKPAPHPAKGATATPARGSVESCNDIFAPAECTLVWYPDVGFGLDCGVVMCAPAPSPWPPEPDEPVWEYPDSGDGGGGGGNTGGGGGLPECDDPNAIFTPAECEESPGDDPEPCEGDPVLNPEITPTAIAGVEGGRFRIGANAVRVDRFGNKVKHKGLDISTPLNPPTSVYAMFGGTVSAIRDTFEPGEYKQDSFGNFVQIVSTVNGQTVVLKFNHLNSVDVFDGQTVSAGDIIGIGGNTGNAAVEGIEPHTHIQAWEVNGSEWILVDPENYMSTQFDEEGNSLNNCN